MEILSIKEIIKRIKNLDRFEATPTDHSFHIKIREYVPFVCAAIHAGGNLREQLFVYKKFKQNLQKREQRMEIISNPCDLISPLLCSKG